MPLSDPSKRWGAGFMAALVDYPLPATKKAAETFEQNPTTAAEKYSSATLSAIGADVWKYLEFVGINPTENITRQIKKLTPDEVERLQSVIIRLWQNPQIQETANGCSDTLSAMVDYTKNPKRFVLKLGQLFEELCRPLHCYFVMYGWAEGAENRLRPEQTTACVQGALFP